jgi:hypothetical protein
MYLADPQTWAQLNPTAGVQKQCLRAKITDAAKATKCITAVRNKAQAALLSIDIDKLIALKQMEIKKIAPAHSRKASKIENIVNHGTNYQHT